MAKRKLFDSKARRQAAYASTLSAMFDGSVTAPVVDLAFPEPPKVDRTDETLAISVIAHAYVGEALRVIDLRFLTGAEIQARGTARQRDLETKLNKEVFRALFGSRPELFGRIAFTERERQSDRLLEKSLFYLQASLPPRQMTTDRPSFNCAAAAAIAAGRRALGTDSKATGAESWDQLTKMGFRFADDGSAFRIQTALNDVAPGLDVGYARGLAMTPGFQLPQTFDDLVHVWGEGNAAWWFQSVTALATSIRSWPPVGRSGPTLQVGM